MHRAAALFGSLALFATLGGLQADEPASKPEAAKSSATPGTSTPTPAGSAPSPSTPTDPEVVRLHLMDGSLISGKLTVAEIDVETDFGKLTVPVTRIRSFRPGLGSHPQLGRRVHELIEELGANQFDQRESAQKALVKLGISVRHELERREDDRDNERRTRIKAILAELDESEGAADEVSEDADQDRTAMIQQDTVETTEFTIVGRIVPKDFTINSPYGPLNVKLSDIRTGERDVNKSETLRRSLAVEGTHLVHMGLKPAKVRVDRGDRISITASGTISMTPWGNRAFSTPDGAANYGWYVENQIPGGALVAKIGDNGPIFKVGSKHTFIADRAGELQFGIGVANNHGNQVFPGQYNVNLVVRRK
jgi:hypothetical protein